MRSALAHRQATSIAGLYAARVASQGDGGGRFEARDLEVSS